MANSYGRKIGADKNNLARSLSALTGIAQGLICDGALNDQEIHFLNQWLTENESVSSQWAGDIITTRVRAVLQDGLITEDEREYLIATLQQLIGGGLESLAEPTHVTELAFDAIEALLYPGSRFCLTGEFVYAPRRSCEELIAVRGGIVGGSITKKLNYLIVGDLGSAEWKHGSYGTKISRAMEYKRDGLPIKIVRESVWTASMDFGSKH